MTDISQQPKRGTNYCQCDQSEYWTSLDNYQSHGGMRYNLHLLLVIDQHHLVSVIIIITLGGGTKVKIIWLLVWREDNITITSSFTEQSSILNQSSEHPEMTPYLCWWSVRKWAPPFVDFIPDTKEVPVTHSWWWMLQIIILTSDPITLITKIDPSPLGAYTLHWSSSPRSGTYLDQQIESESWSGCWQFDRMWISNGHWDAVLSVSNPPLDVVISNLYWAALLWHITRHIAPPSPHCHPALPCATKPLNIVPLVQTFNLKGRNFGG